MVDDEINACQNQVMGNNFDDKVKKAVDNAVNTVENRMHGATLPAMDSFIIQRVEMAVRSITGLSRHGPNSTVQNLDRMDFIRNRENTPLKSSSNRLDLNIDQDSIDEQRDVESFVDGDFPALRSNYDRHAYTHHKCNRKATVEMSL